MALREIVTLPDPVLRRKARKVEDFGAGFQTLVDDMIETMRQAPGVGLAAPQVGISTRLVVVEYAGDDAEEDAPKKLFVVANPEIIPLAEDMVTGIEACLSIPDLVGEVDRLDKILIKGLNRQGRPIKIKTHSWLARIFQHEIDHLNGIVYPDRASRVWKPRDDEELVIAD